MKPLERIRIMQSVCFMLVLCHAAYRPGKACAAGEHSGTTGGEHSSSAAQILCRLCGHELASAGPNISFFPSRLALSSRNDTSIGGRRVYIQLFENPSGMQFEVITFKKADVKLHWPADKHFTWFPGFSWTVATCPRCNTHLGWAFQPNEWPDRITKARFDQSERTFVALITDRLLTEDFASRLLMTPKSFTS